MQKSVSPDGGQAQLIAAELCAISRGRIGRQT